jgi:DNA-binding XRE family transcriptional regulator
MSAPDVTTMTPQERLAAAQERCRALRLAALNTREQRAQVPVVPTRRALMHPIPPPPPPIPFLGRPTVLAAQAARLPRPRPAAPALAVDPATLQDGDTLRRRREALGLSQRALASQAGVGRGSLAELERHTRRHGAGTSMRLAIQQTLDWLEAQAARPAQGPEEAP